jgi:hypothetical protein
MKLGQHEKIITLMIRKKGDQEWFKADDFMLPAIPKDSPLFVGYEAGARLSELHQRFPEIIEVKKEGRYRAVKFRFENITTEVLEGLPTDMRDIIRGELIKIGL